MTDGELSRVHAAALVWARLAAEAAEALKAAGDGEAWAVADGVSRQAAALERAASRWIGVRAYRSAKADDHGGDQHHGGR